MFGLLFLSLRNAGRGGLWANMVIVMAMGAFSRATDWVLRLFELQALRK
jgi:hypothetical protein